MVLGYFTFKKEKSGYGFRVFFHITLNIVPLDARGASASTYQSKRMSVCSLKPSEPVKTYVFSLQ